MYESENPRIPINDSLCYSSRLFLKSLDNEIPAYKPTYEDKKKQKSFLFDCGGGNVHLYPKDIKKAEEYSKSIQCIRSMLFDYFKEEYEDLIRYTKTENGKKSTKGSRKARGNGTPMSAAGCIFQFLPLQKNKVNFDLIFVRFFVKEDIVNCILESLQLKIYPTNANEPSSLENYPESGENFNQYDGKSVYYNFPVEFPEKFDEEQKFKNESIKEIADKLVNFINNYDLSKA